MNIRQLRPSTLAIIGCVLTAVALFGNSGYIQAKALLAQYLIADAWTQTLRDNAAQKTLVTAHKPWAWADAHPVARLRVERYGIEQYVLDGATGSALAFAPGLYAGTRLPDAETHRPMPNTVIAGHHNTHFDFLKRIKTGEHLQLQTFRGNLQHYTVTAIDTYDIRRQRLPVLSGGDTLQLVTCLPRYLGEVHPNQRLVVTAVRTAVVANAF